MSQCTKVLNAFCASDFTKHSGRTTDNEHKLKKERFILAVTRHFFPYENSQEVDQLPRVAVQSLSLEVFKT